MHKKARIWVIVKNGSIWAKCDFDVNFPLTLYYLVMKWVLNPLDQDYSITLSMHFLLNSELSKSMRGNFFFPNSFQHYFYSHHLLLGNPFLNGRGSFYFYSLFQ